MGSDVTITAVNIRGNNFSDCAHGCRYCPIKRKHSPIDLDRYERFVLRLREWKAASGREHLDHFQQPGYHGNYDRPTLEMIARLDGPNAVKGTTLGGLPARDEAECRAWLEELMEFGLKTVHATIAGFGPYHDKWNNKRGNFECLMRMQRVAGELGLKLGQRVLISTGTLPYVPELLAYLEDNLPPATQGWRYACPFFYQTARQKAQPHVEVERIDEKIRDSLPENIRTLMTNKEGRITPSEREWIAHIRAQPEKPYKNALWIRIYAPDMDRLEAQSITEIVDDLERRARAAYAQIPPLHELCERYGDPESTLIYDHQTCVEKLWLDRYRKEHPAVQFDQSLTHFWFGG